MQASSKSRRDRAKHANGFAGLTKRYRVVDGNQELFLDAPDKPYVLCICGLPMLPKYSNGLTEPPRFVCGCKAKVELDRAKERWNKSGRKYFRFTTTL